MKDLAEKLFDLNFVEEFEKAERAIKIVERWHDELVVPAVNELRYAAFHIKEYLKNGQEEDLQKVINHCRRARYDAYEAGIVALIKEFRKFKDDYRQVVISQVIPDFVEIERRFWEALEFINNTNKETREKVYQECEKWYGELSEVIKTLSAARDELNKLIRKEQLRLIAIFFTALGALAGVITLLWSLLH